MSKMTHSLRSTVFLYDHGILETLQTHLYIKIGQGCGEPRAYGPCGPIRWRQEIPIVSLTFPVMQVILGVKTSCAEGGSSKGGRPLRLCLGGGVSSASPSLKTVSTPGVAAPGLWPVLFRSFCVESLRQLTSASPLMCRSSAVFSNDDSLVCKAKRTDL